MARKRLFEEVEKFDLLDRPLSNASLHAAITSLSPVKKGKNSVYFDGIMSDGSSYIRVVGFSADQQKKLASLLELKEPTHLTNCEIKRSCQGDKMEIMLKKFTDIAKSPKKITAPEEYVSIDTPMLISLDQLPDIQDFQRVSIDIKVAYLYEPLRVTGGKRKQDIVIADSSTTARLTLWEERINSMDEEESYALQNVVVRQFRDRKYLSMAKNGSTIKHIEDIGEVAEYDPEIDDDKGQKRDINKASIIAVISLDTYKSCLACKARVESTSPPLGRCSKCSMMQRVDKCADQLSAKLLIEGAADQVLTLCAFGTLLHRMCQVETASDVTQDALLKAPPFSNITYSEKAVITGFNREED